VRRRARAGSTCNPRRRFDPLSLKRIHSLRSETELDQIDGHEPVSGTYRSAKVWSAASATDAQNSILPANWRIQQAGPGLCTPRATAVVFDALHRSLCVAVGECLGYLFTGAWTLLVAIAMLQSSSFGEWLALPGLAAGALLVLGSLEFVGRFEEHGWKLAGTIVPIAYTAWSLWLLAAGVVLLT
jgi:hypothetical protein